MSPKSDLEAEIRETYSLIREYEEKVRLSGDPKEMARFRRDMREQQELLASSVEKYARLCRGGEWTQDISEIAIVCGIKPGSDASSAHPSTTEPAPPHQVDTPANTTTTQVLAEIVQQWPLELREALERRTLVLFMGADLPRAMTGLPARAELAADLARKYGIDPALSLAEVAQRVGQGGSRHQFTSFLRDALDTYAVSPRPFHQLMVELVRDYRLDWVITTAYDDVLEQAFQAATVWLNRVVRSSDLAFIQRDSPTLIKLYGDMRDVESLVVTSDDHYGLWRSREKEGVLNKVRVLLSESVLLFVGYNLNDPDFLLLWRELRDQMGAYRAAAYAFGPDVEESERQVWRDRGVVVLDLLLV